VYVCVCVYVCMCVYVCVYECVCVCVLVSLYTSHFSQDLRQVRVCVSRVCHVCVREKESERERE